MKDYVYLKVEGSKGAVKGESQDTRHEGEIDLLSWSWGMRSPRDLATRGACGRVAYGDLVVEKQIDAASTGLMTLLATNDEIRKAVVSVRRSATDTGDYLVITLGKAVLTSIELAQQPGSEARMVERISLAYETIEISYHGQNTKGDKKGSSTFVGTAGSVK